MQKKASFVSGLNRKGYRNPLLHDLVINPGIKKRISKKRPKGIKHALGFEKAEDSRHLFTKEILQFIMNVSVCDGLIQNFTHGKQCWQVLQR
jgi:hypothetical protein